MTALTTNNSRRDGPARQALGTSQFPTATFVLTSPVDLGDAATTGDTIVVVGSLDVAFSDYGVSAPTAPIVLSVDDHGQMELQLFFQRA